MPLNGPMQTLSLGATLKAALLAAILAGLIVAAFHRVATEPLIDHAIMLEEQGSAHAEAEEPAVDRGTQRNVGLFVGMVLYGLTWALFFAVAYQLSQPWLPASTPAMRGVLLVLGAYFAVALFPFAKYPANPPGVGETESIVLRQGLYLLAIAIGIGGVAVAITLARTLRQRSPLVRSLAPLAFLLMFGAIAYLALPNNPDAIRMPEEVVGAFRALSLAGLTLFWVIFGAGFALLVRRTDRHSMGVTS